MESNALPAHALRQIREHLAAYRKFNRNIRNGAYQGRNGGGELAAWHMDKAESIGRRLNVNVEETRRALGAIWSEHRMAERVSIARDAGQQRPELAARLTNDRRTVRRALAA